MTMSSPGAMPSLSTPSTSPVNTSGVVPWDTVRPLTGWPEASSPTGKANGAVPRGLRRLSGRGDEQRARQRGGRDRRDRGEGPPGPRVVESWDLSLSWMERRPIPPLPGRTLAPAFGCGRVATVHRPPRAGAGDRSRDGDHGPMQQHRDRRRRHRAGSPWQAGLATAADGRRTPSTRPWPRPSSPWPPSPAWSASAVAPSCPSGRRPASRWWSTATSRCRVAGADPGRLGAGLREVVTDVRRRGDPVRRPRLGRHTGHRAPPSRWRTTEYARLPWAD